MADDALDPRILRVSIEVNGKVKTVEDLNISAVGVKYANANQNEAEIKISNLDKDTLDYLLTETSPFNANHTKKKIVVEAGRRSTGASIVYVGDICSATVGQPPDVTVAIKSATAEFSKGNIIQRSQPGLCSLRTVAQRVADDLALLLDFQCRDKQIANYSFTGAALRQVDQLGRCGLVNAYVDDKSLVIKNFGEPKKGSTRILSIDSGMVGTPEFTERGVKVAMLFDNQTTLGSGLQIQSIMNPAVNGLYAVYKLSFDLANRDTPFYLIAEASRTGVPLAVAKKPKKPKK